MASTEIEAFLRQSVMRHSGRRRSGNGPLALELRAPALRPTRKDVRVVKQSVEHGGEGRGVA
jgi:hypothetical protein